MINKAAIIYEREDLNKNQRFVQIITDCLEENQVKTSTFVIGEDSFDSIGKGWLVVNRSRNSTIARTFEDRGAKVVNTSMVTDICNDKWKTYLWAKENDIPVMETTKGNGADCNEFPIVLKSLAGHGGSEVFLCHNQDELDKYAHLIEDKRGKSEYILQPLADTKGKDIRVYVLGEKIVVAMCRSAEGGFKSNYSLGGSAAPYDLNSIEEKTVKHVIDLIKPDYVGIDFIYDGERLVLNEIEDAVGARMVYENTDIDIVKMFGDWMAKYCNI